MILRSAIRSVFSHQTRDLECFADSSNIPWNSVHQIFPVHGRLQQHRKCLFLFSAYRSSPIPFFSERWGVDVSITPWNIFTDFAKSQEMYPRRLQELLQALHDSCEVSCSRILEFFLLSHDSVSVIVLRSTSLSWDSRFTSLSQDFVLCCYQFNLTFCTKCGFTCASSCKEPKWFWCSCISQFSVVFQGSKQQHNIFLVPSSLVHEKSSGTFLCLGRLSYKILSEFL